MKKDLQGRVKELEAALDAIIYEIPVNARLPLVVKIREIAVKARDSEAHTDPHPLAN